MKNKLLVMILVVCIIFLVADCIFLWINLVVPFANEVAGMLVNLIWPPL